MPAVREALQAARTRLATISAHPRLDAETLLAFVLDVDRVALFTHPERSLTPAEAGRFEEVLGRRLTAEPMQYITGSQEFFGLSFAVAPGVLIPRPETELLVETVLQRFDRETSPRLVDVGTGSGAIAIALAHQLPYADVTAVDNSPAALAVAQRNAQRHGVRITLVEADLLAGFPRRTFDLVASNPPYIANGEKLESQVVDFEPAGALFAGPTGLEVYQRLIPQAATVLKPGGWLVLEIGFGQQPALVSLLHSWKNVRFFPDLQDIPRVVEAQLLQ
jgi:release factor glutamine methyltransferase